MNKKLNVIMKELEKERKCVYPFLELTEKEIEYLKSKNVVINYEFIELHHFLIDGTYKKLATVLELCNSEKDFVKKCIFTCPSKPKGFSFISSNKLEVHEDGTIHSKVDVLKRLKEMTEEEEKEFLDIFVKIANKHNLKFK